MKTEIWDINDETELEAFISQMDSEKVRSDNIIIPETAQTSRLTPATNTNITTGVFKQSQDLTGRIIPETNDDKKMEGALLSRM